MMRRREAIAALCLAPFAGHAGTALAAMADLPRGRWTKIHEQSEGDEVRFRRQRHGGAAFDTRRRRIVLFGSDEHGEDWTNSPLFFDPARLRWTRLYPDDDPATYRVNRFGIPVAGDGEEHPWAMHTYGAATYHEGDDTLVVSIYPEHMKPGVFTDAMAHLWPRIERHPTWALNLGTGRWTARTDTTVHFFPYATTYDSQRKLVLGYRSDGVYELRPRPLGWTRVTGPGLLGYHNAAVFDARHDAMVVFGSHEGSDDVVVYRPATKRHEKMPARGLRPPKAQYRPMAFHAGLSRTALLIDGGDVPPIPSHSAPGWSELWLYDLGVDAWTRREDVRLPFRTGMNYNMVYDPVDDALLLVADEPERPTSVWALRL
jgi:hypothetical protein